MPVPDIEADENIGFSGEMPSWSLKVRLHTIKFRKPRLRYCDMCAMMVRGTASNYLVQ